jgi:pyruvate formate lyase activating enzyme
MSVDDIMAEVIADIDFYANSNGGITLSGGEPLVDVSFAIELLKSCKDKGINRCVETSGFLSSNRFMQVLPWIDILLFDYKITGSELHKKYTDVTDELILTNLDIAYHSGTHIILRCPIIPGINDTEQHFKGIRILDEKYPLIKGIELLPYHSMGNSKRVSIGINPTLPNLKSVSPDLPEKWVEQLKQLKCEKVKISAKVLTYLGV